MSLQNSTVDIKPLTIRIAVFDVGQGDTIVISCPETSEAIVVDCIDANQVASYLEEQKIKYLRGVIITHLHADHYFAVSSLIENCFDNPDLPKCEKLLFNYINSISKKQQEKLKVDADGHSNSIDKRATTTAIARLIELYKSDKIIIEPISLRTNKPSSIPLDGILAQNIILLYPHIYHLFDPTQVINWNLNNLSVTLQIQGSGSSALLTGDLEPDGWDALIATGINMNNDVLKLPHHGAWKRADAVNFIQTVNPSVAIISVGTQGYTSYDHPNANVLAALAKFPNIRLLCTQATEQCGLRTSLLANRAKINGILTNNGQKAYLGNSSGCSCAGTTIIELGETVRVIQPSVNLHVDQIIRPSFEDPQCAFPSQSGN